MTTKKNLSKKRFKTNKTKKVTSDSSDSEAEYSSLEESAKKETTPLVPPIQIPGNSQSSAANGAFSSITIPIPENFKTTAKIAVQHFAENAVKAKNSMRKSPVLLSLVVGLSSLGVLWAGLFGIISYIFRLHPVTTVIKAYQVIFASICLGIEVSRYTPLFGLRSHLRRWLPILELNLGRGFLQILTAGLALGGDLGMIEWMPGVILGAAGTLNIVWGVQCAYKLKAVIAKLKEEMEQNATDSFSARNGDNVVGAGGTKSIQFLQKKFAALDLNGDGRLSKEELEIGCHTLNLSLEDGELNMIFSILDPKKKGYIDVDDLELWWYREKDPFSFIV